MTSHPYNPEEDGLTHINVYSKAKTRLGRLMTNLTDLPFEHPTLGHWRCLEGLYYYLITGCRHEELRVMSGFEAKRHGRTLERVWNEQMQRQFCEGIRAKLQASEELQDLLRSSTLPFTHYYFYGRPPQHKIVLPKGHDWMLTCWVRLRRQLREGVSPADLQL